MESRHSKAVIFILVAAGGMCLLLFFEAFQPISLSPPILSPVLPSVRVPESFEKILCHGDLLFREGRTLASEMAKKASLKDRRFSHVGIIVQEEGKTLVIHAIHDKKKGFNGVVEEDLATFLEEGKNFGVYRIRLNKVQLAELTKKAKTLARQKIPYDLNYDLTESEKLYCTEFIFHLLKNFPEAGNIKTTDFLGKDIIAIDNIYENEKIFEVVF